VVVRVDRAEELDEASERGGDRLRRMRRAADDADLPEHERGPRLHYRLALEEPRGLVALTAGGCGIDAEIGEETVLGGDSRQHARLEPFAPGLLDGLMRRQCEDAGVAIEGRADPPARTDRRQDQLDHPRVRLPQLSALDVAVRERARLRVQALHQLGGDGIRDEVQNLVRGSNRRLCLARQPGDADPGADDDE
jgi:hypothetical protein